MMMMMMMMTTTEMMLMTQVVDGVAGLVESPGVELETNDGKDHNCKHHLSGQDGADDDNDNGANEDDDDGGG